MADGQSWLQVCFNPWYVGGVLKADGETIIIMGSLFQSLVCWRGVKRHTGMMKVLEPCVSILGMLEGC